MGDRLTTKDMGRKVGAVVPLSVGSCLLYHVHVAWAEAYLRTRWHLDPFSRLATTDMGQKKLAGFAPFDRDWESWVPI